MVYFHVFLPLVHVNSDILQQMCAGTDGITLVLSCFESSPLMDLHSAKQQARGRPWHWRLDQFVRMRQVAVTFLNEVDRVVL